LEESTGLILNSNTKEAQSTLKYSFGINKPMLSFYRYNKYIPNILEKKLENKEFHIVIIGGMSHKLRDSTHMLKKILQQKIHVHNYVSSPLMERFISNLSEAESKYFHSHESIVSQSELIKEISKYNAGWIVDNSLEIVNMINNINKIEFKELMLIFRLTTISSSLLALGSAGLPIFINKTVVHVTYEFPKDFFIPIEESEVNNFKQIIEDIDWSERYRVTNEKRNLFSIDNKIEQFIKWLEKN